MATVAPAQKLILEFVIHSINIYINKLNAKYTISNEYNSYPVLSLISVCEEAKFNPFITDGGVLSVHNHSHYLKHHWYYKVNQSKAWNAIRRTRFWDCSTNWHMPRFPHWLDICQSESVESRMRKLMRTSMVVGWSLPFYQDNIHYLQILLQIHDNRAIDVLCTFQIQLPMTFDSIKLRWIFSVNHWFL